MLYDFHFFFFWENGKILENCNTLLHNTKTTQSIYFIFALLTFLILFQNKEYLREKI